MKTIAFIGPLPLPLGGVAVINQSFQQIEFFGYEMIHYDTSNQNIRENLYSKFPWRNVVRDLKKGSAITKFIEEEKPDLINIFITSGYSILRDLLYLKKMSKYKIPIILHFHSKTKGEFGLKPWRLKIVGKLFNKYADKIILLSKEHQVYFKSYFGDKKCTVVENFVTYSDFNNEIEQKLDQFLFVGRLTIEKGFFDLLEACKQLKENNIKCKINIVGMAGTENQELEIQKFVKKYELDEYLQFHGAVYGDEKLTLFKRSKILIFPSHFENSPVVLKEAIAAKMAIIASDIEANTNILANKGNHLLFQTGNVGNLSKKIIEAIQNQEKVNSMCLASSQIKDYDVCIAKQKMESIFQELNLA
jgi:glycosyltransferase involved in cell wall biosynthesis